MSETKFGREPIELVEMVLPKCANTYGTAPCTASGAPGSECFNTRATCQDPDNYRDTPDRHLTPDLTAVSGDIIGSGDLTRDDSIFASFDVRFASSPDGVIWEQGGSGTGTGLFVDGGNLIFETNSSNTATISVSADQFAGKSVTLYVEIIFSSSTSCELNLWVFDPVELTLTLLGNDSITPGASWAGTSDGAIGELTGTMVSGRTVGDWNGGVISAFFYDAQTAPTMNDNFRSELWLGRGVFGEPRDEKYILSCLQGLGTIGTRISLFGSDDDYEPLGRRAMLDFTCEDFTHSDYTQDPYLENRLYDPLKRSTFWRKWIERQKFAKVGNLVRVHDGYAGQTLSEYKTRAYSLDRVKRGEDGVAFACRDYLSRTEFRKTQIPQTSEGILSLDLNETGTTLYAAGDVTEDYPSAGTIRINDEIMTYAGTSYDATDNQTDFTGLVRGTDGSDPAAHEQEDLIQICRRLTNAQIPDVLDEWLITDSRIPAQLIALQEIEDEVSQYLFPYRITTLITEPTAMDELLGRLAQECSFYIWWDERQQQIRFKAIRATSDGDVVATFSNESNIVKNSLSVMEKPKERLNVLTFYYRPRDFTGDLDKATNFKNGLRQVDGTVSGPTQYGKLLQTREIYGRFITSSALVAQTAGRIGQRYRDIPLYADFLVDAKDRTYWTGDIVGIDHPMLVDAAGERVISRWLIVESEEVDPGHLVRYVCTNVTVNGELYFITEDGIGDYTEELFAAGNFFITDDDGLNPDGTEGAKIQ